jgi:hypothetical protein
MNFVLKKYAVHNLKSANGNSFFVLNNKTLRQHRTKTAGINFVDTRLCARLACIFSVILANLTKNLTAQYAHNLCAVLP